MSEVENSQLNKLFRWHEYLPMVGNKLIIAYKNKTYLPLERQVSPNK